MSRNQRIVLLLGAVAVAVVAFVIAQPGDDEGDDGRAATTPAPGRPARFRFRADAEGAFEIESHVAQDAGRDPLVARLVVSPS